MLLTKAVSENGLTLEILEDDHFLRSIEEFTLHAKDRKQLRMEYFYREMRKKYKILCNNNEPKGGDWNYDSENRKSFSKDGPGLLPTPIAFPPDKITKQVVKLVNESTPINLEIFIFQIGPLLPLKQKKH